MVSDALGLATLDQSAPTHFRVEPRSSSASGFFAELSLESLSMPLPGLITTLVDSRYRLNRPVQVRIQHEDDYYLVADDVFARYGTGSTVAEAKAEYGRALVDYLEELTELEESLAPHLVADLSRLRKLIEPRRS
ncbi:MAG: hypothetical protein BWY10_00819 [Chloroflexi bacterium ADurb.Bin180]|nr:MAG: hypothetical protein BWY10_00819 [Chloroflexi bacterium ADurb.Bin180]